MKKYFLITLAILSFVILFVNVKATGTSGCDNGTVNYTCGDVVLSNCVMNDNVTSTGGDCFRISADNIILDCQGHILDGRGWGERGISINSTNATIKNCIIQGFYTGIYSNANYGNFMNNTASNNGWVGFYFDSSSNNVLADGTANLNPTCGTMLWGYSLNNTFVNNTFNSNEHYGIEIYGGSLGNNFTDTTTDNNIHDGILIYSLNNTFTGTHSCNNRDYDIEDDRWQNIFTNSVYDLSTPDNSTYFNQTRACSDKTPPTITLIEPDEENYSDMELMSFECYVLDDFNISNVSFYGSWDGGWHDTYTHSHIYDIGVYDWHDNVNITDDGMYTWNCESCDTSGNCAWGENYSVGIDRTGPNASLTFPGDGDNVSPEDTSFECHLEDATDLANISLYSNWSSEWSAKAHTEFPFHYTQFDYMHEFSDVDNGTYIWNCEVCDKMGHCAFSDKNWTINVEKENIPHYCGSTVPCACGDILNDSRTLNANDNLTNCNGNALTISLNYAILNCNGYPISGVLDDSHIGINIEKSSGSVQLSGIVIKNCNITSFTYFGIAATNVTNLILLNNSISGNGILGGGYGVDLATVTHSNLTGNNISFNGGAMHEPGCKKVDCRGVGIKLEGYSNENAFYNNNISLNTFYGIGSTYSNGNLFVNNTIMNNSWDGLWITDSNDNNFSGGEIANNNADQLEGSGFYLGASSSENRISGMNIHDNIGYGIWIEGSGSPDEHNNIINNNIISDSDGGIEVELLNDSTFSGNKIECEKDVEYSGGMRLSESGNLSLSGNNVSDCYYGIMTQDSSQKITISNNRIFNSTQYGIYIIDTIYSNITNNKINSSEFGGAPLSWVSGIELESSREAHNIIKGNNITDSGTFSYGMYIGEGNNRIIDNNIVCGDPNVLFFAGIAVSAEDNAFENNTVSNCSGAFLASKICNFTISGDEYYNNTKGIYLDSVGGCEDNLMPTIANSQMHDNCEGADFVASTANIIDTDFTGNNPDKLEFCGGEGPPFRTGLYVDQDSHVNLENGNFEDNGYYGIDDEPTSDSVDWIISKDTRCTNNNINISDGFIVPFGGSITAENCTIIIGRHELNISNGEQGYMSNNVTTIYNDSTGENVTILGERKASSEITVYTKEEVTGETLNVSFYNQNPTGNSGFSLNPLGIYLNFNASENLEDSLDYYTLKIFYTDEQLAEAGINESTLRIEYYNATSRTWTVYDGDDIGGVDTEGNSVWANIHHFSAFGVFGSLPEEKKKGGGGGGGGGGCTEGAKQCSSSGDALQQCTSGVWITLENCTLGCDSTTLACITSGTQANNNNSENNNSSVNNNGQHTNQNQPSSSQVPQGEKWAWFWIFIALVFCIALVVLIVTLKKVKRG